MMNEVCPVERLKPDFGEPGDIVDICRDPCPDTCR